MRNPFRSVLALLWLAAACVSATAFAADLPYTDVSPGDPFYDDVSTLYERNIIRDNDRHKFDPYSLIRRDDFTAIVLEVGCQRCRIPLPEDVIKYVTPAFPDVGHANENYYCVAIGEDIGIVRGYVLDEYGKTSCQDKTPFTTVPFCPADNISRVEAAAVLLRNAGFWDERRNAGNYERRYTITDTSDYWYGYAMRALDFDLFPIDSRGRVHPDEYINRAEFAHMAVRMLQSNSCEYRSVDEPVDPQFTRNRTKNPSQSFPSRTTWTTPVTPRSPGLPNAIQAKVYPSDNPGSCRGQWPQMAPGEDWGGVLDLYADSVNVPPGSRYEWTLTNTTTSESKTRSGQCLDNEPFSPGVWIGKVQVVLPTGLLGSDAWFQIGERTALDVRINAVPLSMPVNTNVQLTATVGRWTSPYTYSWLFGDGGTATDANPTHVYRTVGNPRVELFVRDSVGNTGYASLVLEVKDDDDYDDDTILNVVDRCPYVYGLPEYYGCPSVPVGTGVTTPLPPVFPSDSCQGGRLNNSAYAYGELASCFSCPCEYRADYTSELVACDVLFPTIMNPSKTAVYARGNDYRVPSR